MRERPCETVTEPPEQACGSPLCVALLTLMSEAIRADLVIIGGGAVELATALNAARRGYQTVLLGRQMFPFADSSSVGTLSRPFELQCDTFESARSVLASVPEWAALQELTGERLITRSGSLLVGDPRLPAVHKRMHAVTKVMSELGISFEELSPLDLSERFGLHGGAERWTAFFQADGGSIDLWATLRVLLRNVEDSNQALLMRGQHVVSVQSTEDGVTVHTSQDMAVRASKLLVAAESRNVDVMRMLGLELLPGTGERVTAFFRADAPTVGTARWTALQERADGALELWRGHPPLRWERPGRAQVGLFSSATDRGAAAGQPPTADELSNISSWVAEHLPRLDTVPSEESLSSRPSFLAPDTPRPLVGDVMADFAPGPDGPRRNIVISSSGNMFSSVPLLGVICADLALNGYTDHDIEHASLHPSLWRPPGNP